MRRLIALVVAAVISCVLISPPSQALPWDPKYPPIPVDRQPSLDRPSGDDSPWNETKSSDHSKPGWLLVLNWTNWTVVFVGEIIPVGPNAKNLSVEDESLQEPSTGFNR
jgi:hypothetical protein